MNEDLEKVVFQMLSHSGVAHDENPPGRGSGRYPYGSGKRPFQGETRVSTTIKNKEKQKKKELLNKVLDVNTALGNVVIPINSRKNNSDVTLRPGEKIYHISGIPFKELKSGKQIYAYYDRIDDAIYGTFLSANLIKKGYLPRKIELTVKDDVRIPSHDRQYRMFKQLVRDHHKIVYDDLSDYLINKGKNGTKADASHNLESMSKNDLYLLFNNSLEEGSSSRNMFYDILLSNGYNAVLDDHDVYGSWMQAKSPIILINPEQTVKITSRTNIKKEDILQDMNHLINLAKSKVY